MLWCDGHRDSASRSIGRARPANDRRPLRRSDLHSFALRHADGSIRLSSPRHGRLAGQRRDGDSTRRNDTGVDAARRRDTRRLWWENGILGLGNGNVDWNDEIAPGPLEIGFDYAFLMPATGDRVPCVYVENRRVLGIDRRDPIRISYREPLLDEPLGASILNYSNSSQVTDMTRRSSTASAASVT